MNIRITSDSTCDLGALVEERKVGIMPLAVTLDDKTFHDGVDITPQRIFDFVAETKILPKTSAINEYQYPEHFENLLSEDGINLSKDINIACVRRL